MINDISKLSSMSPKYIREFIQNCNIEEKIDAHYITIFIKSPTSFDMLKPNGDVIDRVDFILNSMWGKAYVDWTMLMITNKKWFESHVGFKISMFYIPVSKPILTEYKNDVRYVFDRVVAEDGAVMPTDIMDKLAFPNTYGVRFKNILSRRKASEDEIEDAINGKKHIGDILKGLLTDVSEIIAEGTPEGFIFKYKSKLFQMTEGTMRKVDSEKSSYEFLLSDFIKYCHLSDYTDKISTSYTKTICDIFNDYIINYEKPSGKMLKNIEPSSIECPYLGHRFDIGYEYIPNPITKNLCKESDMYKNIFKVLLANMRRGKDSRHCILLSNREVDEWNNIVKNIKIRCTY